MKTKPLSPGRITTQPDLDYFLRAILIILISLPLMFLNQCQTKKATTTEAEGPAFHKWAPTPPMGWNSWDSYGPTVVEDEVKANADYMAKNLKKFGWQYIVIDIRWYVENDKSGGYNQTDPIYDMDEYGRYIPAVNRFPSAANGKGFKPIADYIHSKGLKFGMHLMRGIPVIAVNKNTPVLGSNVKAQDIYTTEGQCGWLRDNYTVVAEKDGAQDYYNSIFKLYASWGLDFVKVDDLSGRTKEIEMVRKAIDNSGRPIVLSISPGGNTVGNADFLKNNSNMWRMTGDFWDNWPQLKPEFAACSSWASLGGTGYYPDGDMLPLGKIGIRAERGQPRMSSFTKDEQYTLMTLFAIFGSPLMFGGDLPSNDEFTLSLITNKDVLNVNQHNINHKQIFRDNNDLIVWSADDPKTGDKYLALFNAADQKPIDADKAVWESDLITQETPGQSVDIDIDINGAKKLYLVATYDDSGAGAGRMASHNCDWIEPKLVTPKGSVNLTDLKWVKASSGRGEPVLNATARGGKLTVNSKEYKNGISANATSVIEYDLPEGVTRFKAKAALDNGVVAGGGFPGAGGASGGRGATAGRGATVGRGATPGRGAAPQGAGQGPNAQVVRSNSAKFLVFVEDPAGPVPPNATEISVKFEQLGLTGTHTVKDLWSGKSLGKFTDEFKQSINHHSAGLYRIH